MTDDRTPDEDLTLDEDDPFGFKGREDLGISERGTIVRPPLDADDDEPPPAVAPPPPPKPGP